jgi:Do/DeqQ family serine protease
MKQSDSLLSKRIYVYTALIALAVSLLVGGIFQLQDDQKVVLKTVDTPPGKAVLYTKDANGDITPIDFTQTSRKVVSGVVHITARGTQPYMRGYRELPDPFRDFFRDSPFGQPFSPPGQGPNGEGSEGMPRIGTGSGVIINTNGYIVTNNHVVDQAEEIEVTLHNNGTYPAQVVGTDPTTDLALLKIEAEDLNALSFVNSDDVEVGEWVLAIGNPFSLNSTVTAGIVSAKARNININREELAVESFIQTDAAINPGNSGGALVNLNGDLIGINTAIASRTGGFSGYGFAVPSNLVSKIVEDLLEYGTVQRGILGVRIQNMDGRLAREKGIEMQPGVYIASVNKGSAAEEAGILEGDIITAVDGKQVRTSPRLQELIAQLRPGDNLELTLLRGGKAKIVAVILKSTAGTTAIVEASDLELRSKLGAEFGTLNKDRAEKLGISSGVELLKLYPGKLRQETQMREGFIITHINGKSIEDLESFKRALEERKAGGIMLEGRYPDSEKRYYYAFGLGS